MTVTDRRGKRPPGLAGCTSGGAVGKWIAEKLFLDVPGEAAFRYLEAG